MPTSPKTIGVIGLGSIGMRHAKNLLAMGHRVLGYDPDGSRMKMLIEQNDPSCEGEAGWGVGPQALCDSCDALVIASPSADHFLQLAMAIKDGLPVLVEKPIATEFLEALSHVLKAARATVMVGNNLRFHNCVKKAREWLDAGLIGQPLWANFTLAQLNDKYIEDVVLNWGAHELDLARYLLGDCEVVAASHASGGIADIILRHGNGCQTTVHLDYLTKPEVRRFSIIGTNGRIIVDLVGRHVWKCGNEKGEHTNPIAEGLDFRGTDSFDQNYIEEMQAFLDRIDGKETLGATGEDGLAVLELCLEARRMAGIA